MKLFYSPTSPYVRKVMVTAIEKGLGDKIEKMTATVTPISRDNPVVAKNPLGKVPALVLDDGRVLFDSSVITAYIDQLKAPYLTPSDPKARFDALTLESLADGFLDAGLLHRYESTLRPEALRWEDWRKGQMAKINGALDALETTYIGQLAGPLGIGQIAVGCALGWFDFRYGDSNWRKSRPKLAAWEKSFAARPSMQSTKPVG
jgi:glutathione S-transferase